MKKYIVGGILAVAGIVLFAITHSGKIGSVGLLIGVALIILGLIVMFGKVAFIERLLGSESASLGRSDSGPRKSTKGRRHVKYSNPAEEAVALANDDLEAGRAMDAVERLEEAAAIVEESGQYVYYGVQALTILGEFFETGNYNKSTIQVDEDRSFGYYERLLKLEPNGDIYLKLGKYLMQKNNISKALLHFEKGAGMKNTGCLARLGSIYEEGLYKYDSFGNRGDTLIEPNLEKARDFYQKLADLGDEQGQSGFERVDYALNNTDSIEFEEKEKLYAKISERRKAANIEFRFKAIEASKLQYQYTYVHDEAEGYIHKLPKDWVKVEDEDSEEMYYAPSEDYKDFAIYVTYDSIPKESTRDLELFLRYDNDVLDYELNIQDYVTEYADGICATYYHKEMEKGIVTFAFRQRNRMACLKFVCATMEIIEQYEEIIFEIANSFAFVDPTVISDESANRKDQQYYSEAVFYYFIGQYDKAMEFARKALNVGSRKASYLLIELYYDEESPYVNYEKALSLAKQLFEANDDPELAFLIGTIYEQQKRDYIDARTWYEKADSLEHPRVPFYLGRLYYYGLLQSKRDGSEALRYFRRAADNGIPEAGAYIQDIEALDGEELQVAVDTWEQEIEDGNADTALQVAIKKQNQVFYLASDYEIDEAYKKACELGSAEAFYRYGVIVRNREKEGNMRDGGIGKKLLERALDMGFEGFDNEYLCEVVDEKARQGLPREEMLIIYYTAAMNGYAPAVEKIVEMVPDLTDATIKLYETLRKFATQGKEESLKSMNRLEQAFPELILKNVEERDGYKVIENDFFKLSVPKEYNAVIDNDGGTIKIADSTVDFAVAEMPIQVEEETEFLKVFKLICDEYMHVNNAEIMVVNSRMVGSSMTNTNGDVCTFSILLISAKNQYLFKMKSRNRIELMGFKEKVYEVARTLVETGAIYIATGERSNEQVGLSRLLSANAEGFLQIGKMDD